MTSDPEVHSEQTPTAISRRGELIVFVVLAVLIWPVLAVGFVGTYGFIVWMSQVLFGPPGPAG